MRTYCIDTSALIDAWKDYPIEHFGVWDKIETLISKKRLISPYHVLDELKVKEDDLYDWCNEKDFFCSPTESTPIKVSEILDKFPTFKPKKKAKVDWADPWVISIAIENGFTVVSHETKKTIAEKTYYIPDICENYTIEHLRFLDIIKKEKWKFL